MNLTITETTKVCTGRRRGRNYVMFITREYQSQFGSFEVECVEYNSFGSVCGSTSRTYHCGGNMIRPLDARRAMIAELNREDEL